MKFKVTLLAPHVETVEANSIHEAVDIVKRNLEDYKPITKLEGLPDIILHSVKAVLPVKEVK